MRRNLRPTGTLPEIWSPFGTPTAARGEMMRPGIEPIQHVSAFIAWVPPTPDEPAHIVQSSSQGHCSGFVSCYRICRSTCLRISVVFIPRRWASQTRKTIRFSRRLLSISSRVGSGLSACLTSL